MKDILARVTVGDIAKDIMLRAGRFLNNTVESIFLK